MKYKLQYKIINNWIAITFFMLSIIEHKGIYMLISNVLLLLTTTLYVKKN